ncbi:MAG: 2-phospho-L-lactate guanylyltransferase [Propionibacteriales bacterium]|nr:2-phospho-L-lactate guanylyltransferase [Propionibacteriales bacterium]
MTTPRFALLIPVKDGRSAKSRLGVGSNEQRARLMAAFARDSISAALASDRVDVHVVGDAANLEHLLAGIDVDVVPDEGAGDLNRALISAAVRVGSPARPVAVMLADLPCLRSQDLADVFDLVAASGLRSFVPDAAGTGTTILAAPSGTDLDPHFGEGSAKAHAASGAVAVALEVSSVRLDVDTTDDLRAALQFGVGPATAAATSELL